MSSGTLTLSGEIILTEEEETSGLSGPCIKTGRNLRMGLWRVQINEYLNCWHVQTLSSLARERIKCFCYSISSTLIMLCLFAMLN